jgi:anti-anti-sigma factor
VLLKQEDRGGARIVAVSGRVDHANAEEFRSALAPVVDACSAGGCKVVLDGAALEYISSAGLRVLMLAARKVQEQDGVMVIAGLRPVVREVFEITRFNLVFRIFDSTAQAVADLAK